MDGRFFIIADTNALSHRGGDFGIPVIFRSEDSSRGIVSGALCSGDFVSFPGWFPR